MGSLQEHTKECHFVVIAGNTMMTETHPGPMKMNDTFKLNKVQERLTKYRSLAKNPDHQMFIDMQMALDEIVKLGSLLNVFNRLQLTYEDFVDRLCEYNVNNDVALDIKELQSKTEEVLLENNLTK